MAGNIEITSRIMKRIPLERLMDLKMDYAFKQLFGNERNREITIVFLNAVLKRTGTDRITGITFTNSEAGGEYAEDKQSRLDLLVVTEKGEWINVEIQFNNQYDMVARSLFYWASVYRNQMRKKMAYRELNPVITVNLMNFNLFHQTDGFHTTFCLYEQEKRFRLTDMMEMHFVEMPKLIRAWKEGKLDPRDDVLARWLLLLGIVDQRNGKIYDDILKELEEIAMKDESLHQAFESWESLSRSPEEIYAYESRLKRILDEEAVVREAELRGEERGEERTLRKMARYMLSNGIEAGKVAEETGLKLQEVLEIQAEIRG